MGEEAHEEPSEEESSNAVQLEFRPGEMLMLYQILTSAEMYLENEDMNSHSAIAGGLAQKVLFAMLDQDFKDAVNEELDSIGQLMGEKNPLSFQ